MAAITSAVVGVVGAGVSIGMSVDQANKAAADRRKAQQAAEKAMEEARRETEIMPMQELSLDFAAYEQAREAQNVAAATAIDAAQQAEGRNLAAAVGRVQAQNIAGQQQIRAQQGREMMALDKVKAQERADASDVRANLSIGEAQGAQAAAADASARQQAATQQAVQAGAEGLTSAFQAYADIQGPYDRTKMPQKDQTMTAMAPVTGYQLPTTNTSAAPQAPVSPYSQYGDLSIYSVLGPDGYPMVAPTGQYLPTQPLGAPVIQ